MKLYERKCQFMVFGESRVKEVYVNIGNVTIQNSRRGLGHELGSL